MSSYDSCPRCGREAESGFTHNWFPLFTCQECDEKYCSDCGEGNGTTCPECGSTSYGEYDKVYAND